MTRRITHGWAQRSVLSILIAVICCVAPSVASAAVDLKINFQPSAFLTPTGYTADTGAAFTAARGYGWVRQDSLSAATHTPLNLSLNTRSRGVAVDGRQDSFIHMQFPSTSGVSGTQVNGAWDVVVPNGDYLVTAGVGDASYIDSVNRVNAEGQTIVANYVPTNANKFQISSGVVHVADGLLTIDAIGGTNTKLDFVTIQDAADSTPPSAPIGLHATAGNNQVGLSWTANTQSDLAGYRVYRSTTPSVDTTGAPLSGASLLSSPTYTDTTAVNGTTYYYVVKAVDTTGNASAASVADSATPQGPVDSTPPAAPTGLDAVGGDGKATLNWTANTESDLAGYRVYRGTTASVNTSGTPLSGAALLTSPTYTDASAVNGTTYYYVVKAVDTTGNASAASAADSATPQAPVDSTAPGAPAGLHATPGNSQVGLTWTANTESDLAGYRVYRGTTASVDTSGVPLSGGALLSSPAYTDTTAVNGTTYYYVVKAVDTTGNASAASSADSATPQPPVDSTPPTAPTGLDAVGGDGKATLTWIANTDPDLAGYRVYRGTSASVDTSGTPLSGASLLTSAAYTDTTAVNGTTYYYVVKAVDTTGNASAASTADSATPQAAAAPQTDLSVNFQTQTTTTPSGYQPDYGQAFDAARGYGWVSASSGDPLSLIGNGRERNVNADKRLDTFVSMQLTPGSAGVTTPGSWKASVVNGTYKVTVAAGDASYIDSHHVITAEGQPVVDFTPTDATKFQTGVATVTVTDGMLDLAATGGANTKIDYVRIQPANPASPHVTAVTPDDGAISVCRDGALTVQLSDGVDPTTATSAGVQLLDGNTPVAGFYNTDGAYSNVTFVPSSNLDANKTYTVKTTSSLKDPAGDSYQAFSSSFTTGATPCAQQSSASFAKSSFDFSDGTSATNTAYKTYAPTALALGPDPNNPTQLWAAFGSGNILVYNLDPATGKPVGTPTQVSNFKLNRIVSSLKFDPSSTAGNIKLWVSNGQFGCDLAAVGIACDDFTGAVSTLTGSSATSMTKTDIVTGLPRSVGNHMNNGIDFGPDGALYLAQGAENGYGAPDAIWGNRAEDPLSATVLRIDLNGLNAPYSVNTSTGYDPTAPGAKVTRYVTGIRNPFSLVWHSNGKLYAPVNESANGNTPADPAGGAPALTDLPAMDDYFTQVVQGKYYGHPNPSRGEYRLNGGNPTTGVDPFEVPQYPVGTQPNSNWRKPDLDLGIHRSADGSAEYKSNVFGAALKGQILLTEYSQGKDIIAVKLDANGNAVSTSVVASGFYNPLPIVTDASSGRVYVGEYGRDPDGDGGKLTLLTPTPTNTNEGYHVNFQTATSTTPTGYSPDAGEAFSTARGYGWENNTSGSPVSLVGNARERNVLADKRLDTFMSMQLAAGSAGVSTPGKWELAVPNGTYNLTVAVGDASYVDSHDVINAEGQKIVDFTPTAAEKNRTVQTQVTVSDGRLTLDPTGGTNTKIDYVDLVPATSSATKLDVTTPEDPLGLGSRLVFSTVAAGARAGHNVTLRNNTGASVNVTGLTFGGANAAEFSLCSGQATTFTIATGGNASVCVQYRPTANTKHVSQGTLTIATNESGSPYTVTLGGLNTPAYEGNNEPDLQQIFDALGYKDNAAVTNTPFPLAIGPDAAATGDEVLSPYWTARDTSKPVTLMPVARYGASLSGADSPRFGWYAKGSTTNNYLYAFPGGTSTGGQNSNYGQNQLLLPTTTTGNLTFNPTGSFGLADEMGWHTDDALNAPPQGWHNYRIYPAKNAAGTTIPGTYLVALDIYSPLNQPGKNWDYQDFAFIMTNAAPDTTTSQPAAGSVTKSLTSFPGNAGGVSNTGFSSVQGTTDASKIAFSGNQLQLGSSTGTPTTRVNALQTGVNTGTGFRVQSRLVGPFTSINSGTSGQFVYWGPSATNYVSAGVKWDTTSGARVLSIDRVQGGTSTNIRQIALPGGTASTVDLRIEGRPSPTDGSSPYVTVSYALNGSSTFTALTTSNLVVPNSWITANTPGGVFATNQGGTAFTATYANFSITRSGL